MGKLKNTELANDGLVNKLRNLEPDTRETDLFFPEVAALCQKLLAKSKSGLSHDETHFLLALFDEVDRLWPQRELLKLARVVKILEEHLKNNPRDSLGHYLLGSLFLECAVDEEDQRLSYRRGELYQIARRAFEMASQSANGDLDAEDMIAHSYYCEGEAAEGQQKYLCFEKAVKLMKS